MCLCWRRYTCLSVCSHPSFVCACLLICVCVCLQVLLSSSRFDARPNAFRRCLFNQNLGLHGKANRKQAALPGKAGSGGWVGGWGRGVEAGAIKRAAGDNRLVDPVFQLQLGDDGGFLCIVTFSTLAVY